MAKVDLPITMLTDADALLQGAYDVSGATLQAVKALLQQPDSAAMRTSVLFLVEALHARVEDAMNTVNSMAEQHGANWVSDCKDRLAIATAVIG